MIWTKRICLLALCLVFLSACGGGGSGSGGDVGGEDVGGEENGGEDDGGEDNGGEDDGGEDPITAAPPAPAATLTARTIKTFAFSWSDVSEESEYRLLENPDGMSGYSEVAVLPADSTRHTLNVSLSQRVNASYILQACNSQGCTDSDEMFVSGSLAEAVGYFKATNTDAGDRFGYSIALSANGQVMAIGAPGEDSSTGVGSDLTDNAMEDAGAVYVFVHTRGIWTPQFYLKASNPGEGDSFGRSLAISADGTILAVGAALEDSNATGIDGDQSDNSASDSGAVYVFKQGINTWTQRAYIKASNTGVGDRFGGSLSLSADGTLLAVGASWEDSSASGIPSISNDQMNDAAGDSGAVYLFKSVTTSGSNWSQQAYIKASNTGGGDRFGYRLALSADGSVLAVGAKGEDGPDNFFDDSGAVYMFTHNGDAWSQQSFITPSKIFDRYRFGSDLALSADGSILAVSAPRDFNTAGFAYVFTQSGNAWSQQAMIEASNAWETDYFGQSIALSADGSVLAVSAYMEQSNATGINGNETDNSANGSGAVYLFSQSTGAWSQQAYIKAPNTGNEDRFGYPGLALSSDGGTLAVGAALEDSSATRINGDQADNSAEGSGAVYLY